MKPPVYPPPESIQAAFEVLLTALDLNRYPKATREVFRTVFFLGADAAFNRVRFPDGTLPPGFSFRQMMEERLESVIRLRDELKDFQTEFIDATGGIQ